MESPLSPALCGMVIACLESVCARTFAETLTNIHLRSCFLMYVDKRLLFSPRHLMQLPCTSLDAIYNFILGQWEEVITYLVKTIFLC